MYQYICLHLFDIEKVSGINNYQHHLLSHPGELWKEQRKFVTRSLKQLGSGAGEGLEAMVLEEVDQVILLSSSCSTLTLPDDPAPGVPLT